MKLLMKLQARRNVRDLKPHEKITLALLEAHEQKKSKKPSKSRPDNEGE